MTRRASSGARALPAEKSGRGHREHCASPGLDFRSSRRRSVATEGTRIELSGVAIRRYLAGDLDALLHLSARLTIGIAPWRSAAGMQAAARTWVESSIAKSGQEGTVFVAEQHGHVVGFASVAREVAFTGEAQAYIGELAVGAEAEGQGVGQALLAAVEGWAREQDLPLLVLDTGSANARGRRFYARAGFQEESVRLTKVLSRADSRI